MLSTNEQRPYFCLHALANEETGKADKMENVAAYLQNALSEPWRASEFEEAAECVLRNNGFDPSKEQGWKAAGIENGRAAAVETIKKAYLKAVPSALKAIEADVKTNPYDYKPSAVQLNNPLVHLVSCFERGHQGQNASYLVSDEAWQEAGVGTITDFQQSVRNSFVAAKVGGYVAHDLNIDDESQIDALSVEAADYAIQKASPLFAAKLNIPASNEVGLAPQKTMAASAFGKAKDCQPY